MEREYEVVLHAQMNPLNLFVVDMHYRPPHLHDDLELGMVLSGELTINTIQSEYHLQAGDLYLLNPKELHELSANLENARILALQLSRDYLAARKKQKTRYTAVALQPSFADAERLYELLQALTIELAVRYLRHSPDSEAVCFQLLHLMTYLIDRFVPIQQVPKEAPSLALRNSRIARITDYISNNFQSKLLLNDIAQRENLSLSYLSHFFKDSLNTTFQDYVNKQRVEYACILLRRTEKSIAEVSDLSGFSDVRYLVRSFEKFFACTPNEYRHTAESSIPYREDLPTFQRVLPDRESLDVLEAQYGWMRKRLDSISIGELLSGTAAPVTDAACARSQNPFFSPSSA